MACDNSILSTSIDQSAFVTSQSVNSPDLSAHYDEEPEYKQFLHECDVSKDKLENIHTDLNAAFMKWLKSVNLDHHKDIWCTISGTKPVKNRSTKVVPLFEDRSLDINNASSHRELWRIVQDYVCWTNCKLMKVIVKSVSKETGAASGTAEFDESYAQYEAALRKYCNNSIKDHPFAMDPNSTKDQDPLVSCTAKNPVLKVKVQMSFETITHGEIQRFEGEMAKVLGLEKYSLKLTNCSAGCTQLLYSIPQCLHRTMFPLTDDQLKQLSLLQITEFETIGYHFTINKSTSVLKLSSNTAMKVEPPEVSLELTLMLCNHALMIIVVHVHLPHSIQKAILRKAKLVWLLLNASD